MPRQVTNDGQAGKQYRRLEGVLAVGLQEPRSLAKACLRPVAELREQPFPTDNRRSYAGDCGSSAYSEDISDQLDLAFLKAAPRVAFVAAPLK